ncbi:acyl-CoA synthetase [Nocardioides terrisoli]|uniref:acyl-CoA synthetase n=1 Tax=Nocardioides terrisoli TaxID=3388267 RepID=UPI00287BA3B0|nr:acyl-CoA synthetase [Nocardioides marmorisolisilvae]
MALNIADLFEHAVDAVPDRPVLVVGDRTVTYAELEADANRLAHFLTSRGIGKGDHVGIYAKNSIEHVVALLGVFKVRAVAVNVNYRYVEGELDYLFENSDIVALLFERPYAPLVARTAPKHARLTTLVAMPDPTEPTCDTELDAFAGLTWTDALADQGPERDFGPRSPDDVYIVYTGGTTGFPKGVMWRHEDFWRVLGGGIDFMSGERLEEYDQSKQAAATENPMVMFPLSPLMHGGAQAALLMHLFGGALTVLAPRFDPAETWRIVEREKVQGIFMTGDAMARPLIEAYDAGSYDASSLVVVASSAAIFSRPVKERWMATFPNAFFTDSVGSSETGFSGTGLQDSENIKGEGPVVSLGAEAVVLDDDNRVIDPSAVGTIGRMARAGSVPLGYYKDPEKSAKTFVEIDGVRYSIPGDFARMEGDGKVTLLGRGSNCINTGGEKVYPEEVEMALKGHPDVYDVLVVGVADDKYGQHVSAVVQPREGRRPELADLQDYLRPLLSGYKLPRSLTNVDEIPRSATGKANYPAAKALAAAGREDARDAVREQ